MNLITALSKLQSIGQPLIYTKDAAVLLGTTPPHASQILNRLTTSKQLVKLMRGLFAFPEKLDLLMLPEALTRPLPSYISLQTALFYHGMISQIPSILYAVSLDRARIIKTPLGTVSLHHVEPHFFTGYEVDSATQVKMATTEKALIDFFYFMPARSLVFRGLPELELPDSFDKRKALAFTTLIRSKSRRTLVQQQLELYTC